MKSIWLLSFWAAVFWTAVAQAQIKIGVAGPFTGANATFGAQIKNGAAQAVEDINKAGGILGQQIVLIDGDDASDPRQGISVANKFAAEGVKAVVGHFNSGASIPASEVYAESGIVQITPASTNPKFTERKLWNTFRTCSRDDQQGAVAGAYLADKFKGKNIALVHDKTPYGRGLADETLKALKAKGGKDVLFEGINPGEKDYSALVSKLKQAKTDVVYYGGLHTEAGLIVRQMHDQGLNVPLMSGDGISDKEFAQIAGPGAEGTLMTFSPDARKNPNAKGVVAAFRAKKIDPEAYTLYSYAAVQILKTAMEDANSTDGKAVAEVMRSGKAFKTVIGDIVYDKKGDITRPDFTIYVWTKQYNGKIGYVERYVKTRTEVYLDVPTTERRYVKGGSIGLGSASFSPGESVSIPISAMDVFKRIQIDSLVRESVRDFFNFDALQGGGPWISKDKSIIAQITRLDRELAECRLEIYGLSKFMALGSSDWVERHRWQISLSLIDDRKLKLFTHDYEPMLRTTAALIPVDDDKFDYIPRSYDNALKAFQDKFQEKIRENLESAIRITTGNYR